MPDLPEPDCFIALDRMPVVPDLAADSFASSHSLVTPQGTTAAPSADLFTGIIVMGIVLPALLQAFWASP